MNRKSLVPGWFQALIVSSALLVGYGLTHPRQLESQTTAPAEIEAQARVENKDLFDVMWIDKYPQLQTDQWKAYMFTSDNIGLSFDAHSAFKITIELFEFKADKSKLTYHFPHDARKAACGYKIEKMKKPTKHFDTQLTVENDPQSAGVTHVYYTGPDFRSLETLPESVRQAVSGNEAAKFSLSRHSN